MHRDEALAVMVARRPLGELLETVQLVRGGAPLHFLLAKLVAEFGGGLVATRAVSAAGMLLAIVAVGLLGRALGGPAVGAGAAWIVALSPVALYYGDFARMYSLFLAFSALSLWCLVRALETDEPHFWAGTAVLLVLTTYTHPYGVVVGLIAALTVLAELLQVRERAAWRRPLYAAAGVIAGTAPLGIGYVVLASRLDKVPQPPGVTIAKPSLSDVAAQAGAHFVGVPRSGGGLITVYLVVCGALALVGLVTIARGGAGRAVLVVAWIALPLAVLAVVRIPNSDNHVRYVIETLPLAGIAIAYGASTLGRMLGWRGAVVAALTAAALVTAVEATRGARLADYRYRGDRWAQQKAALGSAAGYLRINFARNDLFLGYDEAFAAGVLSPGHNDALASARGTARSEPQLIVRSLKRLHGPIAHGWYVALRGTSVVRYERFVSQLAGDYEVETFGTFVLVRTRAAVPTPIAFARAGLRVFEAARELSGPARAPSKQAAVTAQALRGALPDLR
jgi:Dolichyl-phosphate-mannose-protein mannosyltransferase